MTYFACADFELPILHELKPGYRIAIWWSGWWSSAIGSTCQYFDLIEDQPFVVDTGVFE